MAETTTQKDPRQQEPKPPFAQGKQQYPGHDAQMSPVPDHGEKSYKGHGRLQGRAALITGADSGIGRAVAIAFAREGADVLISYLEEDKDAQETERWVKEAGRKAVRVPGDISKQAHCDSLIQRAVSEFGRLDILVNNAAFQMAQQTIEQVTPEQFEHTFHVNVFGMFYLCRAAIPHMKPGSAIINTTSIQAFDPSGMLLDYASTKSAIAGFTHALAHQAIEKGIRVNGVAPGPVWTPLIPATMPAEKVKNFGQNTAFGRPAQPAELAPVYVLLASPEASYITGEIYGVTGGRTPL